MRRCLPLLSAFPLAVLVLVTACSGDAADLGPTATLGTAPTTAPRAVDPAVIPADLSEIDEPYVQAVVDALFAVDAEATKIFVATKTLDQRAIDYLAAIYVREEAERQVNIWLQSLALRSELLLPGVLRNDVQRVIDVGSDCVYVEVESDYSEVNTKGASLTMNYLGLTPKIEGDDAQGRNPTAWMMFMDGVNLDGSVPENPCAGR